MPYPSAQPHSSAIPRVCSRLRRSRKARSRPLAQWVSPARRACYDPPPEQSGSMLHINDLEYRVQGDLLFDRATVAVNKGERVGLVGRNGAGKTTLLKLIAGTLHADGGSISYPRLLRIGTVAQDAPSGQPSLIDTVLAADRAERKSTRL